MAEPILQERSLHVDRRRVGISYSGGGAMVLTELGIAQAFIELGIVPHAIAGVSAGAVAAAAHAIDPVHGAGVRLAAQSLVHVNNGSLGLGFWQIAWRLLMERSRMKGLGSNESIKGLLVGGFRELAGTDHLTFDYFGRDGRPELIVAATDRLTGEAVRFPGDADVADALVASSAIPGLFAPKAMTMNGVPRLFVDGGATNNQPLSMLALDGCGTIYACAVGYDGGALAAPTNLIDNFLKSIGILLHSSSRLEQAYVQLQMGDEGVINHIHPEIVFPVKGFNFTPEAIAQVMHDAREATIAWIEAQGLRPPGEAADVESRR